MKWLIFLVFTFSLGAQGADKKKQEKILHLEEVLKQTRSQAPKVLASLEKVVASREKVLAAKGQFDSEVALDFEGRYGGAFPNKQYKGKVQKPLRYFNSKVFAGYRLSEGDFRVYEGKNTTWDDGEVMAGLEMSLLRNAFIDKKRLKLGISEFKFEENEWQNKDVMMKLQKEASFAYWNWVAAGLTMAVAQDLLDLSLNRQVAFERRIKKGDLAQLYAVENRQYIVKRKSTLRKAQADFTIASLYLSLYWRNAQGEPQVPGAKLLPPIEEAEERVYIDEEKNRGKIVKANFKLKALEAQLNVVGKQEEFFKSRFLPQLDLKYEVSRDRGEGSRTLRGTEHKVLLGMTIPLERRLLKGNERAIKAEKRILNYQKRLLKDQLKVQLEELGTKLEASLDVMKNTKEEVKLGKQLEAGEKRKFQSGASDFFVVNLREQNTFDARLRRIEALYVYQETLAKYREILLDYPL